MEQHRTSGSGTAHHAASNARCATPAAPSTPGPDPPEATSAAVLRPGNMVASGMDRPCHFRLLRCPYERSSSPTLPPTWMTSKAMFSPSRSQSSHSTSHWQVRASCCRLRFIFSFSPCSGSGKPRSKQRHGFSGRSAHQVVAARRKGALRQR